MRAAAELQVSWSLFLICCALERTELKATSLCIAEVSGQFVTNEKIRDIFILEGLEGVRRTKRVEENLCGGCFDSCL